MDETGTSVSAPQDPSLIPSSQKICQKIAIKSDLMISISPVTDSLVSLTKKSMFGLPMPILITDTGTPLYRPVMVRNPLSDDRTYGFGLSSKRDATV